MKKIRDYIRYLFFIPAKTQEEIETKRKELNKLKKVFLFIALGGVGLMILLSVCFKSLSTGTASGICTPIVCIGVFGFVLINRSLNMLARQEEVYSKLSCPKCSSRISFDENVDFDVVKSFEKRNESAKDGNVKIEQIFYNTLAVSCKCQKCGYIHQFEETFRTEKYVNAECKYSYDLPSLVKDYFSGRAQFDNK